MLLSDLSFEKIPVTEESRANHKQITIGML